VSFPCKFSINLSAARLCRFLTCIAIVAASSIAVAQAGQLDPTFASNGILADTFGGGINFASVVALQSDGKIVVGGEIGSLGAVVRLNTNGTFDNSFGSSGVVTIKFRDAENVATGLAIQSDGKIVVVGTGLPGFGQLVRLNSNGSFDTSFGRNGSVFLSVTPGVLALQADGKILITGGSMPSPVAQRFETNGQLDTSFGTGGSAPLVGLGAIALQSDGKIIIPTGGISGVVVRYNSNGSLDKAYGISGQAAILAGPGAVAIQADGRSVTAGTATSKLSLSGNTTGFDLERMSSTGTIDTTFGTRGAAITSFPNSPTAGADALVIQPNGDLVAAGQAGSQSASSFALARYLSTGKLDTTFGTGGLVTTSFGNTTASITALALQSDGKIVAAGFNGTTFPGGNSSLVVARYLGQ
jgi:uncharacterized delta-60 repeat protein